MKAGQKQLMIFYYCFGGEYMRAREYAYGVRSQRQRAIAGRRAESGGLMQDMPGRQCYPHLPASNTSATLSRPRRAGDGFRQRC